MIATAADVQQDPNWNGRSLVHHEGGGSEMVDNLESTMSFAEHQRIVCAARQLIVTFAPDKTTWAAGGATTAALAAFADMRECYDSADTRLTLKVSKGIHQPYHDPHMQLELHRDGEAIKGRRFHLNVSATPLAERPDYLSEQTYQWAAHSFGFMVDKRIFQWPENAGERLVKHRAFKGATRRNSISDDGLKQARIAHEMAVAKAARDEKVSKVLGPALVKFANENKKNGIPFLRKPQKDALYENGTLKFSGWTITWDEAAGKYVGGRD